MAAQGRQAGPRRLPKVGMQGALRMREKRTTIRSIDDFASSLENALHLRVRKGYIHVGPDHHMLIGDYAKEITPINERNNQNLRNGQRVQKITFNIYEIPEGEDKPSFRHVEFTRDVLLNEAGDVIEAQCGEWNIQEPAHTTNTIQLTIASGQLQKITSNQHPRLEEHRLQAVEDAKSQLGIVQENLFPGDVKSETYVKGTLRLVPAMMFFHAQTSRPLRQVLARSGWLH